jgi:hypothetical protein
LSERAGRARGRRCRPGARAGGPQPEGNRGGSRPLADTLHDHQRRRDRAIRGIYDFTLGLAAFPQANPVQRHFLAAVAADQQETDRFLGAFAGIVPPEDYFTLGTVVRVLGTRGIRRLMRRPAHAVTG